MLTPEHREVVDFASTQISNLNKEIATLNGFITHFITTKYNVKNQQEMDSLLGVNQSPILSLVPDSEIRPTDTELPAEVIGGE